MAAFSVTVAETLGVFGIAPTVRWNAGTWNAFTWGENKTLLASTVGVGIAESTTETAAVANKIGTVVAESETPSETVGVVPVLPVSESVTTTGGNSSVNVRDSAGYYHVFSDNTTDGEGRDIPSWSSGSAGSATWTSAAVTAPTWS